MSGRSRGKTDPKRSLHVASLSPFAVAFACQRCSYVHDANNQTNRSDQKMPAESESCEASEDESLNRADRNQGPENGQRPANDAIRYNERLCEWAQEFL